MELLWFTCTAHPHDLPSHPFRRHVVAVPADRVSGFDPAGLLRRQPYGAVVIEVEDDFTDRASSLLAALRMAATVPLWVLDRACTQARQESWLARGASHVATDIEEILTLAEQLEAGVRPRQGLRGDAEHAGALVGDSRAMQSVAASIRLVADKRCNVLIEGETGTGKEVVARQIHSSGGRSRGPWVAVNCGAIPETLLEAELFGHVRGAFTGAVQSRAGKFEAANRGTIFLDEIGEMPLPVQAKLLRVLQEREIERLGGNERIRLDVRVIAATNTHLARRVREGLFRQDLYYRLNVFRIALTPLRERPADIPPLARHFVARFCEIEKLRSRAIEDSAIQKLLAHDWPGNARELENVMEAALILSGSGATIGASDIHFSQEVSEDAFASPGGRTHADEAGRMPGMTIPAEGLDYQEALHAFEHSLLTQAITRTRGNKTAAADLLRLKRTTLSARMRALESRLPRLVA